ncbi:MAG: CvpA family protein [Candidatus Omnitrophota bacterium]
MIYDILSKFNPKKAVMDIVNHINWVDVLVAILLIRISYVAFQEGFTHEVFPLVGSIIVIVTSLHWYMTLGDLISRTFFNLPVQVTDFLGFLIIALAANIIVKLTSGLLNKIVKMQWHPLIEKFGGLILGIARASVVASLVLAVLALTPLPYLQRSIRDKSLTGVYFLRIGPSIYSKVAGFLPVMKASRESLMSNLLLDKPISSKAVKVDKEPAEQ